MVIISNGIIFFICGILVPVLISHIFFANEYDAIIIAIGIFLISLLSCGTVALFGTIIEDQRRIIQLLLEAVTNREYGKK